MPDDPCFPFSEAREKAIRSFSDAEEPLPPIADMTLPFEPLEGKDKSATAVKEVFVPPPPKVRPPMRITWQRIDKHKPTPGCPGCKAIQAGTNVSEGYTYHTVDCLDRWMKILGKEPVSSMEEDTDASPASAGGAARGPPPPLLDVIPSDPKPITEEEKKARSEEFAAYDRAIAEREGDSGARASDDPAGSSAAAPPAVEYEDPDDRPLISFYEPLPKEDEDAPAPSGFLMSAIMKDRPKYGRMITYDMSDYVMQAVEHYQKLSGTDKKKMRSAPTPFCPDGVLLPENEEERGELSSAAASICMKVRTMGRTVSSTRLVAAYRETGIQASLLVAQ